MSQFKLGILQELALYGEFTLRETLLYFGWIAGMTTPEVNRANISCILRIAYIRLHLECQNEFFDRLFELYTLCLVLRMMLLQ